MTFQYNFYSVFLLVFWIHTGIYAVLFFRRYFIQQQAAALWMGTFLLLVNLYTAPWMLGFAGWYDNQPYRTILFYVPFQNLFWIGPVIYFYLVSLLNPKFTLKKKEYLHFLPGLLYLLFSGWVALYDLEIAKSPYFLANGEDPDFNPVYQGLGLISMFFYGLAALRYYYFYRTALESVLSNTADFLFVWMRWFLFIFLSLLVYRLTFLFLEITVGLDYAGIWWYFFGFIIGGYILAIAGYAHEGTSKIYFQSKFWSPQVQWYLATPRALLGSTTATDFVDFSEEPEVASEVDWSEWIQKIETTITENQLHNDPDLTLFAMAQVFQMHPVQLSKIINQGFGKNFNDLINAFRVDHFKDLIFQNRHQRETLLALALECGFNSKATFNRAFKKQEGVSPQAYIKAQKNRDN
ncbi:MAG: hypothetical protein RLZ77_1564 [Bacteroidota bacterium]|jgi:AraC-like DNA-binding protein